MKEKLHAKRAATEEHIRELEKEGKAGERYTITMPDTAFMFLGLLCDIGWALQLIFGNWFFNRSIDQAVSPGAKTVVAIDLFLILAGVLYTIHLGKIHEKEIVLRYQKNLSFGLTVLGGIFGIVVGAYIGAKGLMIGGILNTAGGLPIYLSFRKGIRYGVR